MEGSFGNLTAKQDIAQVAAPFCRALFYAAVADVEGIVPDIELCLLELRR